MENKQNNKPWNISPGNEQKTMRYKPVISAIVAAVCIIIYLSAIVQATVRLYLSVDNSKIVAEQEFSFIADTAAEMQNFNFGYVLLGLIVAAAVGFIAIKSLRWIIKKNRLDVFGYYCLVLGAAVIIASVAGA